MTTPVLFTDRDRGKKFPEILRAAGLRVERHADHFAPDCPDETWLAEIGKRGWVAVTHDGRIRCKPNERAAVLENCVALLVVIGRAPCPELAHAFVATWPRILGFIERHEPPYIAKVYRSSSGTAADAPAVPGRIELWYPAAAGKPNR